MHQGLFINKETMAKVFSCEFCEIYKNKFFYRTPLVAAFEINKSTFHCKVPFIVFVCFYSSTLHKNFALTVAMHM